MPSLNAGAGRQGLGRARPGGPAVKAARSRSRPPTSTRRSGRRRPRSRPRRTPRRALVNPPVSTQVYIDTDRGTIQIELAVLDAPLTVDNFVTLARQGLLRRPQHPPRRTRFRHSGRRSARRRRGRARLHDSRRAQRAAVPARHGRHGARSLARHGRQPVLHHAFAAAASRREVHASSAAWSAAWTSSTGSSRATSSGASGSGTDSR